ncbi:hypothetical protein S7711_06862 [Stachybotrys chartarum IBT 7711]|uniref:Glucose-methanol-choline oxidoreductase N-terminal domain-containing protein n=1 Tax=Stachybotrys chartarum (strain CBS 109288 / IBT 7711) TaxID=1280523 RepID=A0A084B7B7_STACB|nr:hypothetical protein S7711_06862 [Stachybotrys chartarum IBT 7711]
MGGLYDSIPHGLTEVDVVIVGGGTSGCVVAARLSDAHPDLSILVVERGPDNFNDPAITNPIFFMENILNTGTDNPRMMTYSGRDPEPEAGNRVMSVPAGSVLGGGSSINMLTYTRPQREELDWKMPGWSAKEILPFMNKVETYHGPGAQSMHGSSGPIQVSDGGFSIKSFQDDFIRAAARVGIRESIDLQALDDNQAIQRNLRYISPDGVRSDAAHAYLHPRLQDNQHPNLHVLVQHEVVRVLTENTVAVGVEICRNPLYQNDPSIHKIMARKMVIMSAGTLGTPLILERSGIGSAEVLGTAGVDVVVDLPGIGEAFQDHNTLILSYYTSQPTTDTYDVLLDGRTTLQTMLAEKNEMLAWNSAEITSKLRPTEKEIESHTSMSTEARGMWKRDFANFPNKPVATISTAGGFIAKIPEEDRDARFLSTGNFLLHPYARGHVHITGPSMSDKLDLFSGILTDQAGFDLAMSTWLYKKTREIVRRLDVYRGEVAMLHPPFAATSAAAIKRRSEPLPNDVEDIQYTAEDDRILGEWVRNALSQNWHGIGTCKMAPRHERGVIDHNLDVYGAKNLKVVDLSVVPVNQAANTANLAFTIGEKGGSIIAEELGSRV